MMRSELIAEYGCTGCGRMDTFTDPCRCPEPDETETEDNDEGGEQVATYCHDERHETPCPLPCAACEDECDSTTWTTETEDND